MGVPNSENQQQKMFKAQLRGEKIDPRSLISLGLDVIFLEEKFDTFKPFLEYMGGLQRLENIFGYEHNVDWQTHSEKWKTVVEASGLTGTKCLRFIRHRTYHHQLLQLFNADRIVIEVFLTRDAQWLVYTNHSVKEGEITRHESLEDLAHFLRMVQVETENRFVHVDAGVADDRSPLVSIGLRLDEMVDETLQDRESFVDSLRSLKVTMKKQSAVIGQ